MYTCTHIHDTRAVFHEFIRACVIDYSSVHMCKHVATVEHIYMNLYALSYIDIPITQNLKHVTKHKDSKRYDPIWDLRGVISY